MGAMLDSRTGLTTQNRPVVYVVDDDTSIREALKSLISSAGWQAETFPSAHDFLARAHARVPNCLVLNIRLPDYSGLELQKRISSERADTPVIFVSGVGDVPTTVKAMKAGAVEFLTKPFCDDELLNAIGQALDQSRSALAFESEMKTLRDRHDSLSVREQEVMALVVTGLLNKQVAFELGISEITVKAHRGRVMRKLGATALADLINMARRLGVRSESSVGRSTDDH